MVRRALRRIVVIACVTRYVWRVSVSVSVDDRSHIPRPPPRRPRESEINKSIRGGGETDLKWSYSFRFRPLVACVLHVTQLNYTAPLSSASGDSTHRHSDTARGPP